MKSVFKEAGGVFSVAPSPSLKGGYGNRRVVRCEQCGSVVFDGDPGNAVGVRYAEAMAHDAIKSHRCSTPKEPTP